METHGIKDDFEIHNNINLDNLRGLELNIADNINVGIGTSSSNNIHNTSVSISSNSNNPFDSNNFDEYLRNNKDKRQ